MTPSLPMRGDGGARPSGLPLPPARMPLLRDGRPLKRWTYVGVYGPEVMLCAARVRIGGIPQAFWAVLDRADGALSERTVFTPGLVAVGDGRLTVRGRGVDIALALEPAGTPVEVTSPHGRSYIWTRKEPVRARGTVTAGGHRREIDHLGLIDSSAGYHARETAWSWSAGAGRTADGRAVHWNLVAGVHDAERDSERTVWLDGVPQETGPVRFEDDLSGVAPAAGGPGLRFAAEAERSRTDDLKLFRSSYRQPFGTFSGTLPGGAEPAEGYGVMERHDVLW